MSDLVVGADGRARCRWVGTDEVYLRYHDEEWGTPLHGDHALFEKLSLEGFQAGLSWITILRRRETFRVAFAGFDIDAVADFDDDDVARLMADPGIIRNRAKIDATISNARLVRELIRDAPGALDALLWSFAPPLVLEAALTNGVFAALAEKPQTATCRRPARNQRPPARRCARSATVSSGRRPCTP